MFSSCKLCKSDHPLPPCYSSIMTPLCCVISQQWTLWNVPAKDHTSPPGEATGLHPAPLPAAAPPLHHSSHCTQKSYYSEWIQTTRQAQRRQASMAEDQLQPLKGFGWDKEELCAVERGVFWPLGWSRRQTPQRAHVGADQSDMGVQRSREPGAVGGVLRQWDRRTKWSVLEA